MQYTQAELEAYLDEALPADDMARFEEALRADRDLLAELAATNARRDGGAHSLGAIWRRHRLSCPTREQLGGYLLTTLSSAWSEYITFHVQVIGCRRCQANLSDLSRQQAEAADAAQSRRRKYFQSSAGYLSRK